MPLRSLEGMHLFQIAIGITPLVLEIYAGLKHPETNEAIRHLSYGVLESTIAFSAAVVLEGPFHRLKNYFHRYNSSSE